jgi:hypothetical protein
MRLVFTLLVFAGLATWADAQSAPPAITGGERLQLFRANHKLLEQLIDHSLKLSNADTKLAQAEECRQALVSLTNELNTVGAATSADPDRVAELSDHMSDLIESGLAPTLQVVREQVRNGSPGAAQLDRIEKQATTDLDNLRTQLILDSRLSKSKKVEAATTRLKAMTKQITSSN